MSQTLMRSKVPDPGAALGKKLVDANALTKQAGDLVCARSITLIAASTWAQGAQVLGWIRHVVVAHAESVGCDGVGWWCAKADATRQHLGPSRVLVGGSWTSGPFTADVVAELMDVLADEPRVVACDLAGMTAEGSAMLAKGFAPAGEYLMHWPGTVVMVYAPDPQVRSRLHAAMSGARLLIHIPRDAAATETLRLLQSLARGRAMIPARSAGKSVWVVLNAATGQRHRRHTHRQQASRAHDAPGRWERRHDGSLF